MAKSTTRVQMLRSLGADTVFYHYKDSVFTAAFKLIYKLQRVKKMSHSVLCVFLKLWF